MLTLDTREWVMRLAQGQWKDFLQYHYSKQPAELVMKLLERTPRGMPNDIIAKFLKYAAQLQGALDAFPLLGSLEPAEEAHPKAISWLAHIQSRSGERYVVIKLDFDRLQGQNQQAVSGASYQQLGRIVRASCLHEIGHLFMHWQRILEGRKENALWARPSDEAEAWCFACTLLEMAVEHIAMEFVGQPSLDHVWEYMRDSKL